VQGLTLMVSVVEGEGGGGKCSRSVVHVGGRVRCGEREGERGGGGLTLMASMVEGPFLIETKYLGCPENLHLVQGEG